MSSKTKSPPERQERVLEQDQSRETTPFFQMVRNFVTNYCSDTTIHGFRYLTERRRHGTERCWWMLAIGLALWFCAASIQGVWIKWRDSPVTMTFTEAVTPISAIPFPTITICPEVKATYVRLYLNNFNKWDGRPIEAWNVSRVESAQIEALSQICPGLWSRYKISGQKFLGDTFFRLVQEIAPELKNTLFFCHWAVIDWDFQCATLFVPILTEEGVCFSYNNLNSRDIYTENVAQQTLKSVVDQPNISGWSLEKGYDDIAVHSTYPIHVYGSKQSDAFTISLSGLLDDVEYQCRGVYTSGFKVFLHTPGDVLRLSDPAVHVSFDEQVTVALKPKMVTTAKGLQKYRPSQRNCFFSSERPLRFFTIYTEQNCEIECLANYTVQKCGCVKFSMPRNETTKICGLANIACYRDAFLNLFKTDLIDGLPTEQGKSFRRNCNCLPGCTTITYDTEISRSKYVWKEGASWDHPNELKDGVSYNLVTIYFKHHEISTKKREEQYTTTDFLAICGGLLGLCLGISALSVIEFIYFFTIRFFWAVRKWNSKIEDGINK